MSLFDKLPNDVLDIIAQKIIEPTIYDDIADGSYISLFSQKSDVVRDIISISFTSKEMMSSLGISMAEKYFPLDDIETVYVELFGKNALYDKKCTNDSINVNPKLKVCDLKMICRRLKIKVSGNKQELINRIKESHSDWLNKTKGGRDCFSHIPMKSKEQSKKEYDAFIKNSIADIQNKYALDDSDIESSKNTRISRRKAIQLFLSKYGTFQAFINEKKKREKQRLEQRKTRRNELSNALSARRWNLYIRSDSYLCSEYIEGRSKLTLEQVVDATEEIHFFYQYTNYPFILSNLRYQDRKYDYEFGDSHYWRKRDMVKDGIIEDIDDDTPDCSDDESENEEEQRRKIAKDKALKNWIHEKQKNCSDDTWKELLPRTFLLKLNNNSQK